MARMIQSNQSIKSKYMLNFLENLLVRWPFLGNIRFCWLFLGYFESNPLIQSYQSRQSTQSPTLWKRIESVTNQLTWKRNWINSTNFAEKNIRFKAIISVELISIQVCPKGAFISTEGPPRPAEGYIGTTEACFSPTEGLVRLNEDHFRPKEDHLGR